MRPREFLVESIAATTFTVATTTEGTSRVQDFAGHRSTTTTIIHAGLTIVQITILTTTAVECTNSHLFHRLQRRTRERTFGGRIIFTSIITGTRTIAGITDREEEDGSITTAAAVTIMATTPIWPIESLAGMCLHRTEIATAPQRRIITRTNRSHLSLGIKTKAINNNLLVLRLVGPSSISTTPLLVINSCNNINSNTEEQKRRITIKHSLRPARLLRP